MAVPDLATIEARRNVSGLDGGSRAGIVYDRYLDVFYVSSAPLSDISKGGFAIVERAPGGDINVSDHNNGTLFSENNGTSYPARVLTEKFYTGQYIRSSVGEKLATINEDDPDNNYIGGARLSTPTPSRVNIINTESGFITKTRVVDQDNNIVTDLPDPPTRIAGRATASLGTNTDGYMMNVREHGVNFQYRSADGTNAKTVWNPSDPSDPFDLADTQFASVGYEDKLYGLVGLNEGTNTDLYADLFICAADQNGDQVATFTKNNSFGGEDDGWSISTSPDGNYIYACVSWSSSVHKIIKLNASDLTVDWENTYPVMADGNATSPADGATNILLDFTAGDGGWLVWTNGPSLVIVDKDTGALEEHREWNEFGERVTKFAMPLPDDERAIIGTRAKMLELAWPSQYMDVNLFDSYNYFNWQHTTHIDRSNSDHFDGSGIFTTSGEVAERLSKRKFVKSGGVPLTNYGYRNTDDNPGFVKIGGEDVRVKK